MGYIYTPLPLPYLWSTSLNYSTAVALLETCLNFPFAVRTLN